MIMINDFKKEVRNWSEIIGVKPKEIQIRKMTRKWASCSNKGRLTFSFELLNKSEEQRSVVIVHELLHLRYHTHNKMFNLMLNTYLAQKGIDANSIEL